MCQVHSWQQWLLTVDGNPLFISLLQKNFFFSKYIYIISDFITFVLFHRTLACLSERGNFYNNFVLVIICNITLNDCLRPPLSAIFSPWVILPLIYKSTSCNLYLEYWSTMHCALLRNALMVALFHHCIMLPSLSN